MGWLDHQEAAHSGANEENSGKKAIEVHMPGAPEGTFVPVGKSQIRRKYERERGPRLLIVLDEVAELLLPSKVKTEAGKNEDALKQEITAILMSIAQLGRSAGVNLILCPLALDTIIPTRDGYKTMLEIRPGDYVFSDKNSQTKVLSVSEVKQAETMYEITLEQMRFFWEEQPEHQAEPLHLKCDGDHRWPVFIENSGTKLSTRKLETEFKKDKEICFFGSDSAYVVTSIKQIPSQPVRCIEVASSNHLFYVTDKEHANEKWKGGCSYPYPAVLTCNTQRNDAPIHADFELQVEREGNQVRLPWSQLQVGDKFEDGSEIEYITQWDFQPCLDLKDQNGKTLVTGTSDHLVLAEVLENGKRVNTGNFTQSRLARERLQEQDARWVTLGDVQQCLQTGLEVYCLTDPSTLGNKPKRKKHFFEKEYTQTWAFDSKDKIKISECHSHGDGGLPVRCVGTNTGHYKINGVLHHNTTIPGQLQSNSLSLDTRLRVKRLVE